MQESSPPQFAHSMGKLRWDASAVDNAGQGKGLKIPVDHRLVGNAHYLRELITKLHRKQEKEGSDWKIRGSRKCDCQD